MDKRTKEYKRTQEINQLIEGTDLSLQYGKNWYWDYRPRLETPEGLLIELDSMGAENGTSWLVEGFSCSAKSWRKIYNRAHFYVQEHKKGLSPEEIDEEWYKWEDSMYF